jgi:hypothetical protein
MKYIILCHMNPGFRPRGKMLMTEKNSGIIQKLK